MSKQYPTVPELEAEYKLFTDSIERALARSAPVSPPAQKPASVPGGSGAGLVGTRFHVFVGPAKSHFGVASLRNLTWSSYTRLDFDSEDFGSMDAPDWFPSGSHMAVSVYGHPVTIANAGCRS